MFLNAYTLEQVVKDRNGLAPKRYGKFYLALYITSSLNSKLGHPLEYKNLGESLVFYFNHSSHLHFPKFQYLLLVILSLTGFTMNLSSSS